MVLLSHEQRFQLYDFVLAARESNQPVASHIEQILVHLMSNIDVRKAEQLLDKPERELVRCTFELIKNDYLLDNSLITHSEYKKTICKAQAVVTGCFRRHGN